ncbi:MAG: hypothetical protein JSW48_16690 [Betaproteobacteria bacterium]|jgi:hypothetical protein|nr:MAG: hypothetical protein JSW48_16690 [Betaproteobacteria bacterium]
MKQFALVGAALAMTLLHSPWPEQSMRSAHAQEQLEAQCPQGEDWLECRAAAGDPLAKYRLGRIAYEKARETGDFSKPLQIGRELVAQNDRNGERLLKMTHLQLSWGNHEDYVQAYVWLVEDRQAGIDYLDKLISNLAAEMTPQQLAQAKDLSGQ